jgi:sugar lactone lactonase YvrE
VVGRRAEALYWIDINAPSLNRLILRWHQRAWPMPQAIGCFALRARGGFVVALRDGIWFVDRQGVL